MISSNSALKLVKAMFKPQCPTRVMFMVN